MVLTGCVWMMVGASSVRASEVSQEAQQQTAPSLQGQGPYSLGALIHTALERSQWLAAWKARIEERRFAALQAGAWKNPSVGFLGGAKRNASESGVSKGPVYDVALTQGVYFPGKQQLRKEIGNVQTDAGRIDLVQTELFIAHDVVRLSYQYTMARRKNAFTQRRRRGYQLIQAFLQNHPLPSPQQQAEGRIVAARLGNLVAEGMQIRGDVQALFEKLNLYLGLDSSLLATLPRINVPWLKGLATLQKSQWLESAMRNNPGLAAQRLRVSASLKEKDLAASEVMPDFDVSAMYEQETAGDKERRFGLGVALPFPLLNQNRDEVRSLERKIEAEQRLLRYYEQQLASQWGQSYSQYNAACQTAAQYPVGLLSDLTAQLKEAEMEFRKGRLQLLTFLEHDAAIAETYFRALDAQYRLLDSFLNLLFLVGERDILPRLAGL